MKNRDFKGIGIPKEIWLSKDLTLQEKVFLVEIVSLSNENGCFANNKYFADFFGISKNRVSLVIKSLVNKGYITNQLIYKEGTKEILKRVLRENGKFSNYHYEIINNFTENTIEEVDNEWI